MSDKRVSYHDLEQTRPPVPRSPIIDQHGRPLTRSDKSELEPMPDRHPQQMRPQRLQPYGRPDHLDNYPAYDQHLHQHNAPAVNVAVNTSAYRPWKEELYLSGWKTFGNFLAFPFRLVGRLVEQLMLMMAGVLKIALMAVIMPSLLFAGFQFYQAHKDQPATETAHEVGKAGIGLVGSVLGGAWDGIFGSDEYEKPDTKK